MNAFILISSQKNSYCAVSQALSGDHRMLSGILPALCVLIASTLVHILFISCTVTTFLLVTYPHYCAVSYFLAHPAYCFPERASQSTNLISLPYSKQDKTTTTKIFGSTFPALLLKLSLKFSLICLFSNCKE